MEHVSLVVMYSVMTLTALSLTATSKSNTFHPTRCFSPTIPKKLIRELYRDVHVRDNSLAWNFAQFENLKKMFIEGREGLVVHIGEKSDPKKLTDAFISENYKAGGKQFLENLQGLEQESGLKVEIEAGLRYYLTDSVDMCIIVTGISPEM